MAFFTRSKASIPVVPTEDGDEISEDDWEEDLDERRTPDGRSSKTSFELRRDTAQSEEQKVAEVVECKNPCLKEDETKTDVSYDFVVDRVFGVQV